MIKHRYILSVICFYKIYNSHLFFVNKSTGKVLHKSETNVIIIMIIKIKIKEKKKKDKYKKASKI